MSSSHNCLAWDNRTINKVNTRRELSRVAPAEVLDALKNEHAGRPRRGGSQLRGLRALIRRAATNAGKCDTCSRAVSRAVEQARRGGDPVLPRGSGYADEDLIAELCCVIEDAAKARRMHSHDLGQSNQLLEAVLADDSARQLRASDGTLSGLGADLIALAVLLEGPRTTEEQEGGGV